MGDINKLFVFKSLFTTPSNVLPLHLKQTFPPIIWIFTEGDVIESRLPFKIFSTLINISSAFFHLTLSPWENKYTIGIFKCQNCWFYFGIFDNKGGIFPSILGSNFGLGGGLWLSINFATPLWSLAGSKENIDPK